MILRCCMNGALRRSPIQSKTEDLAEDLTRAQWHSLPLMARPELRRWKRISMIAVNHLEAHPLRSCTRTQMGLPRFPVMRPLPPFEVLVGPRRTIEGPASLNDRGGNLVRDVPVVRLDGPPAEDLVEDPVGLASPCLAHLRKEELVRDGLAIDPRALWWSARLAPTPPAVFCDDKPGNIYQTSA